jgi:hypothetical protein
VLDNEIDTSVVVHVGQAQLTREVPRSEIEKGTTPARPGPRPDTDPGHVRNRPDQVLSAVAIEIRELERWSPHAGYDRVGHERAIAPAEKQRDGLVAEVRDREIGSTVAIDLADSDVRGTVSGIEGGKRRNRDASSSRSGRRVRRG